MRHIFHEAYAEKIIIENFIYSLRKIEFGVKENLPLEIVEYLESLWNISERLNCLK